jgi:hypothetical protein
VQLLSQSEQIFVTNVRNTQREEEKEAWVKKYRKRRKRRTIS